MLDSVEILIYLNTCINMNIISSYSGVIYLTFQKGSETI